MFGWLKPARIKADGLSRRNLHAASVPDPEPNRGGSDGRGHQSPADGRTTGSRGVSGVPFWPLNSRSHSKKWVYLGGVSRYVKRQRRASVLRPFRRMDGVRASRAVASKKRERALRSTSKGRPHEHDVKKRAREREREDVQRLRGCLENALWVVLGGHEADWMDSVAWLVGE